MSAFPLPKKYHPDFRHPGVKPVGGVELDWSNPLTRGLKTCYFAGYPIDLVTGQPVEVNAPINPVLGDLSADANGSTSRNVILPTVSLNGAATWVMNVYRRSDVAGNSDYLFDHDNATARTLLYNLSGGLDYELYIGGAYRAKATVASFLPAGEKRNVAITWDQSSATKQRFFSNGLQVATGTNSASGTYDFTPHLLERYTNASLWDGAIAYYYYYDRSLSAREILALERDPYQIFKPRTPLFFITASAGGGASVSPTDLQSSSTVDESVISLGRTVSFDDLGGLSTVDESVISLGRTVNFNDLSSASTVDESVVTLDGSALSEDLSSVATLGSSAISLSISSGTTGLLTSSSLDALSVSITRSIDSVDLSSASSLGVSGAEYTIDPGAIFFDSDTITFDSTGYTFDIVLEIAGTASSLTTNSSLGSSISRHSYMIESNDLVALSALGSSFITAFVEAFSNDLSSSAVLGASPVNLARSIVSYDLLSVTYLDESVISVPFSIYDAQSIYIESLSPRYFVESLSPSYYIEEY